MLTLLRVKNLALVEEASVAFEPGLNIITGETGAGKSILIGALYLLLGERADTSAVRAGESQCVVEATFHLDNPKVVNALLEESGLEPCADGQLILRRVVKAAGGGQAFVNDAPVTLPLLKRLGTGLVDLHGPHDHQSLFQPASQLDILDAYARAETERAPYAAAFEKWQTLLARRAELSADVGDLAAQIDLLAYRVKEIEEAAPVEGEEDKVRDEQQTVGNAQRILELGQQFTQAATEDENSALSILAPARKALEELARLMPAAQAWPEELRVHTDAIAALSGTIQRELSTLDSDPARLEWLDQRLATYDKLKRKYGPGLAEILQTLETSQARLKDLQSRDQQRATVQKEIAATEKELQHLGTALRKRRAAAAEKLAPAITAELKALGFGTGLSPSNSRRPRRRRPPASTRSNSRSPRTSASRCARCAPSRRRARSRASCSPSRSSWPRPTGSPCWCSTRSTRTSAAKPPMPSARSWRRRRSGARSWPSPICRRWRRAAPITSPCGNPSATAARTRPSCRWTRPRASKNWRGCSAAATPPAWPCATPPNCSPPRRNGDGPRRRKSAPRRRKRNYHLL